MFLVCNSTIVVLGTSCHDISLCSGLINFIKENFPQNENKKFGQKCLKNNYILKYILR